MSGTFQPLAKQFPIVDDSGQPTEYFIRWAQQRQIDIGEGISGADAEKIVQDWAETRSVLAGNGLSGGGTLDDDVTLSLDATLGDLSDVDLSTPPEDQQVLMWDEAAAKWVPADQSGGGGDGGHRFWRMLITVGWNDANQSRSGCAELILTDVFGGTSKTVGGVATGSSGNASLAFDGNTSTAWDTGSNSSPRPYFIAYEFPTKIRIVEARVVVNGAAANGYLRFCSPRSGVFQYSDNGVDWFEAWTFNDIFQQDIGNSLLTATIRDPNYVPPYNDKVPVGGNTGQVLTKKSNADGDTIWTTPSGGGGGGGGPATLLYSWNQAVDGNLPNVPIIVDVSNYDTCQVIISQVAKAANNSFQVNFSTDGGVTFDTATVYRVDISSSGTPGFNDPALYQSGASTAARSFGWSFLNLRANAPVIIQGQRQGIYDRALPVTHVRVAVNAIATSGQIYVMGK
jgi:hypothetical protein